MFKGVDLITKETIERDSKQELLKELNDRFQRYNKEIREEEQENTIICYCNKGVYYLIKR